MTNTAETGHNKNLANFVTLNSYVYAYGAVYNPSNPNIVLSALNDLSAKSLIVVQAVDAAKPAYSVARAERETAFAPLKKLVTRIMNALLASNTSPEIDASVKTIVRKIQGKRATPWKTEEEKQVMEAEGKTAKEISSSQTGYDNQLENLYQLIQLLINVKQYAPNETELQTTSLTELYNNLKAKNEAVLAATVPLSNARIARNEVLYNNPSGLFYVAAEVKQYVKSIFGATSPQYKQISKLKFTKLR